MSGLPFVVQPRLAPVMELIGSDESGKIEVQRRGYLSVGEKAFVQQARTADSGTVELIALARKVSREINVSLDAAYNIVVGIISGTEKGKQAQKVEETFAEELQEIIRSLSNGQAREEMIMAAALLMNRIETGFDVSQINTIHPDIIQGLAQLYKEEEAKNIEKLKKGESEGAEMSIEEMEKKPKQGN
jgi:hypothetical protein